MMHITGRNVIIESSPGIHTKGSPFNGQTGEVMAFRFDVTQGRVALLIRFGEKLGVFYHDEVKLSPEEVQEMDREAGFRRRYVEGSIGE
jgi:hypothetical protein